MSSPRRFYNNNGSTLPRQGLLVMMLTVFATTATIPGSYGFVVSNPIQKPISSISTATTATTATTPRTMFPISKTLSTTTTTRKIPRNQPLHAATTNDNYQETASNNKSQQQQQQQQQQQSSLNLGLIGQNALNQALIGTTIWTGGAGYQVLSQHTQLGPFNVLIGIAGLIPLLSLSRYIETSESYIFSGLNLSTNMAVLRMFGGTPKPILALIISTLLAGLTGLVEEVTFRGQILPALTNNSNFGHGDVLMGTILSSLLFAFLHTNPTSLLKGGEAALDNWTLFVLQFINGSIFASLFLATNGNLVAPILAHTIYDLYTFYKTHMIDVAGQMEYATTSKTLMMPQCQSREIEQKWIHERGNEFVQEAKQSFLLMDTNRDGVLSRKELRVALFSYGINLSKLQSEQVTKAADIDDSGEIDFDEFLEFVGPSGSTGKAVRNTLFGPL